MTSTSPSLDAVHSREELQVVDDLIQELERIWEELERVERQVEPKVLRLDAAWRRSAINLLQYVEFRKHEIRPLQERLSHLGLSSLGRAEGHVAATLKAVLKTLHHLADRTPPPRLKEGETVGYSEGSELIEAHSSALLGPPRQRRQARIMVTMPSEAATDARLVREMVAAGMNCMRINCAHDGEAEWKAMIANLREAEAEMGRQCRILMDLAGPKLRTGAIAARPVVKCRPQRDEFGRVVSPSRIWLYPEGDPGVLPAAGAHIPLERGFLAELAPGDGVRLTDTRGAKRRLRIVESAGACRWAECSGTVYLASGLELRLEGSRQGRVARICELPALDSFVVLKPGDSLWLTASQEPGCAAAACARGCATDFASVPCTLPEVLAVVKAGETIAFDDGKIRGRIAEAGPERLLIEITHAPPGGAKLRPDKGINLPQSKLNLPALTQEDLACLPFVLEHADMVGMSFVERPGDVLKLQQRIQGQGGRQPGIVLKIETSRAFQALPALVVAAMHHPCAGVMIARGDLAVECGFERMAEIQEEILWLCEAAHIPVIWATQVLETLAKSGLPTRAEITDAAMAERAECVMLNKGPHILAAMRALTDILERMEGHQHKKQALLRQLQSWEHAHEIFESVSGALDGSPAPTGGEQPA